MMISVCEARHASSVLPRSSSHEDGVCENDKFAFAGDDGSGVGLSAGAQPCIEGFEIGVPMVGGGESRHEHGFAQSGAAAGDMALAVALGRLVVEGRYSEHGGRLLAGEASQFRHADQQACRSALAKAWNGEEKVEPLAQHLILAQASDEPAQFAPPLLFERLDRLVETGKEPLGGEALALGLEHDQAFIKHIDEGQGLRQGLQLRRWRLLPGTVEKLDQLGR